MKKIKHLKGQAVLIVMLSLSVVLIVVLYIMSRSITDITLSTKEENSLRAFSAAEAGIERALVFATNQNGGFDNATFDARVSNFAQNANTVIYPFALKSGEIATFWFFRPSETPFIGNQVKVCWGIAGTSASTAQTPAVEITVFYRTPAGVYQVARKSLDPNSGRTVGTNNFAIASAAPCTIASESFAFQDTVNFASLGIASYATPGVLQFMTVKPLYNTTLAHEIGIDVSGSGSLLPSQGIKVVSDGTFSDSNRSIEVFQLHPTVPAVFMNAIFSSSGIVQ